MDDEVIDIPTEHRDFALNADNQQELDKLFPLLDIEYDDLDNAIETMTTAYNQYVKKCLSAFPKYNKDGFIVPDSMTTKTRIKRLGIMLNTLYPLLRKEIPDLTMMECSVAILFYYFSILHTNELGWDTPEVIKAFNSLNISLKYNVLENEAIKIKPKNQMLIDSVSVAKKMQKNVDKCLIYLSFLASNDNYSIFFNKTRGGKIKKKKQSKSKKKKQTKSKKKKQSKKHK